MSNHVEIWNKCLSVIKDNVTEQGYKTWFEPIVPISLSDDVLTLQVPTQFFYEYLEEHYIDHLRTAIKRFVGAKGKLAYTMPVDSANSSGSITLPSSNLLSVSPLRNGFRKAPSIRLSSPD